MKKGQRQGGRPHESLSNPTHAVLKSANTKIKKMQIAPNELLKTKEQKSAPNESMK